MTKRIFTEPLRLAESYLDEIGPRLIYKNGFFYRFFLDIGTYLELSEDFLKADIMRFLQSQPNGVDDAKKSQVSETIANLKGLCLIEEKKKTSHWISYPKGLDLGFSFFHVRNGILCFRIIDGRLETKLLAHTPDYFSLGKTQYDFDPNANCPTWKEFLIDTLPDQKKRIFVQQWFGYNLDFDTSGEKFVILFGEGANGKTVVCVVLRGLLGTDLVSAVPLEYLSPGRTFDIAELDGKLANIAEEIGEIDQSIDAILKLIVSGGEIQVQRKRKDPYKCKMTARLTYATNHLPRFRDASSGLTRRMVVVNFSKQILDESKQRKEFGQINFWQESGELSGILNWALNGLLDLKLVGGFRVPESSKEIVDEHFLDINPARTYLLENFCSTEDGKEMLPMEIYDGFSNWCEARGFRALNLANFSKELKRTFPTVKQAKNALLRSGKRVRPFMGIKRLDSPVSSIFRDSPIDRLEI